MPSTQDAASLARHGWIRRLTHLNHFRCDQTRRTRRNEIAFACARRTEPVTVLLLAIGYVDNDEILKIFDNTVYLPHTIAADTEATLTVGVRAVFEDGNGNPVFALPGQEFGPELDVHAEFATPGTYRLWAQFRLADGDVLTVPFPVEAR